LFVGDGGGIVWLSQRLLDVAAALAEPALVAALVGGDGIEGDVVRWSWRWRWSRWCRWQWRWRQLLVLVAVAALFGTVADGGGGIGNGGGNVWLSQRLLEVAAALAEPASVMVAALVVWGVRTMRQ
jgi:hypothetical protein